MSDNRVQYITGFVLYGNVTSLKLLGVEERVVHFPLFTLTLFCMPDASDYTFNSLPRLFKVILTIQIQGCRQSFLEVYQ